MLRVGRDRVAIGHFERRGVEPHQARGGLGACRLATGQEDGGGARRHDSEAYRNCRDKNGSPTRARLGHGQTEGAARLVHQRPTSWLTVIGRLRHRTVENRVDGDGKLGPTIARTRRLLLQVGVDHGDIGCPSERERPGEGLEQQTPEGINVGATVDLVAPNLLGCDVIDGAHQLAVGRAPVGDTLGKSEVREVGVLASALLVEKHVRRLDVAVDKASRVRRVERIRDLRGDGECPSRLERSLASKQRLEVRPFDVAHGDEEPSLRLACLVDRHDVGMVEAGRDPRLALEPIPENLILCIAVGEDLERDVPVEPLVTGAVDLTHPTPADELLDAVPRDLRADDAPADVCHRRSILVENVTKKKARPGQAPGRAAYLSRRRSRGRSRGSGSRVQPWLCRMPSATLRAGDPGAPCTSSRCRRSRRSGPSSGCTPSYQ